MELKEGSQRSMQQHHQTRQRTNGEFEGGNPRDSFRSGSSDRVKILTVMENALETDFNAVAAEKNKDAAAADAQDETSQGSTRMAALVAVATRQIGATWRVMCGGRGMCAQGYPASGCRRGP